MIKAKYEKGHFVPLGKIDIEAGQIVELNIVKKNISWKGALKRLKENSVQLQHKIKDMW